MTGTLFRLRKINSFLPFTNNFFQTFFFFFLVIMVHLWRTRAWGVCSESVSDSKVLLMHSYYTEIELHWIKLNYLYMKIYLYIVYMCCIKTCKGSCNNKTNQSNEQHAFTVYAAGLVLFFITIMLFWGERNSRALVRGLHLPYTILHYDLNICYKYVLAWLPFLFAT